LSVEKNHARSLHPGGVNLALGDGSVRFVSDHVDLAMWRAAATRAGGEVLGQL
jgi:prepilin-type processing-associated H-X9-DG protein